MTQIVPRWEWRTFDVGDAVAAFASLAPDELLESSELYVLASTGADVVKVRDELMDVKRLHEVDDAGLELWSPVLKAAFPLTADDVAAVLAALGVVAELPTGRTSYTLAELLDEVITPHPDLLAVDVNKHRQRYTVEGCAGELTTVTTTYGTTRTIALESEDPDKVVNAVRTVGLAGRPNVNYGRGLRLMAGFGAERFAVVDVGTNSVKFHIAERRADGAWDTVVDRADVTRLGEGLGETGRLNPEPMARTVEAIAGMADEARRNRVAAVAAVGTAGMRIADNGPQLVRAVKERCGVEIEILSGEDEARLAYLAATAGLDTQGSLVVFDTGGGSSQFSFGDGDRVDERFSLEVGAVRFTEQFGLDGAVGQDAVSGALEAISEALATLDGRTPPETLVGMGGGLTNLAAVKHSLASYDPDVVQGTVLDADEVDRQIELYRTRSADERREIVGLQPARAEVILAGACVVRTVMRLLGKGSLVVSDRGLRYGVLSERFG